ncbi:uncharacterized protein EV422DRAFT_314832 [Fimicolochytrium jonesii]|uniref:uncharacterized protein n=1 Tax=Fimicolochytrium jonesii TaxID=1396493 RepID=UPI0022FE298F|nr:uncharacterized protein EV422DRAFT_314832 [Fimicolochytrium jonesii]KAI8824276.1 hypothetical protein EV422DRAFT_314832 [Fimicolochytrium jonesii]
MTHHRKKLPPKGTKPLTSYFNSVPPKKGGLITTYFGRSDSANQEEEEPIVTPPEPEDNMPALPVKSESDDRAGNARTPGLKRNKSIDDGYRQPKRVKIEVEIVSPPRRASSSRAQATTATKEGKVDPILETPVRATSTIANAPRTADPNAVSDDDALSDHEFRLGQEVELEVASRRSLCLLWTNCLPTKESWTRDANSKRILRLPSNKL